MIAGIVFFFIPYLCFFQLISHCFKLPKVHIIYTVIIATIMWLVSWAFGYWLYLGIFNGLLVGEVTIYGMLWSLFAIVISYQKYNKSMKTE